MTSNGGRSRPFDDPVALPRGRALVTLRDAAQFVTALPRQNTTPRHGKPRWKCCLWSSNRTAPTMFARIAMMRALNGHDVKAVPEPRRKAARA
jgi:hypothetical protein